MKYGEPVSDIQTHQWHSLTMVTRQKGRLVMMNHIVTQKTSQLIDDKSVNGTIIQGLLTIQYFFPL